MTPLMISVGRVPANIANTDSPWSSPAEADRLPVLSIHPPGLSWPAVARPLLLNPLSISLLWIALLLIAIPGAVANAESVSQFENVAKAQVGQESAKHQLLTGGGEEPRVNPAAELEAMVQHSSVDPLSNRPLQGLRTELPWQALEPLGAKRLKHWLQATDGDQSDAQQLTDQLLYQLAEHFAKQRKPARVQSYLQRLLSHYPNSAYATEARYRLGLGHLRANQPLVAQAYLAEASGDGDWQHQAFARLALSWTYLLQTQAEMARQYLYPLLQSQLEIQSIDELALNLLAEQQPDPQWQAQMLKRELFADSIRALGISYLQQGGAEQLARDLDAYQAQDYDFLIYSALGSLYAGYERCYAQAIALYQQYLERYPADPKRVHYQAKIVEAYRRAGALNEALEARQQLYLGFGPQSAYWQTAGPGYQAATRDYLRTYLRELVQHYDQRARQVPEEQALTYRRQALVWGQRYMQMFAGQAHAAPISFVLGQQQAGLFEFAAAAESFAMAAYQYPRHEQSLNAGLQALEALNQALLRSTDEAQLRTRRAELASQFAQQFGYDPRAAGFLGLAAWDYWYLDQQAAALKHADALIHWPAEMQPGLLAEAWLLRGHSLFAKQDYRAAQQAYSEALSLWQGNRPPTNPAVGPPISRPELVEHLATSLFQQAQTALAEQRTEAALGLYVQLVEQWPQTQARIDAQFDGATLFMQQQQWSEAIAWLLELRQSFPQHERQRDTHAKLIACYEGAERWAEAAAALVQYIKDAEPDVQRRGTFQAAGYFEKASDLQRAGQTYLRYVRLYPEPLDPAVEARYRLSEIAAAQADTKRRDHWLRDLIKADREAAQHNSNSDRSRYLAARASLLLAEQSQGQFVEIPLDWPLHASLARKKQALQQSLSLYRQALAYRVEDVTTEATYQIAELYHQLYEAVLAAEPPAGLAAEEGLAFQRLLVEQAHPFADIVVDIHKRNLEWARLGVYNEAVEKSFQVLSQLVPERLGKDIEVPRALAN